MRHVDGNAHAGYHGRWRNSGNGDIVTYAISRIIRYSPVREGTENINNIPVLGGLKYNINENVYFGTSVGASFYDKDAAKKATLLHSPYVGLKMKHISMDLRYFNWRGRSNTENSLGVVVSYIL